MADSVGATGKRPLPDLTVLGSASDLEVELEGEVEEAPDAPRAVLITGASGVIGRKLRAAWADRYELILLDAEPGDDPDVVPADLAEWDEGWIALLDEADAVVHLAANPDPDASWAELVGPNLDATAHVLMAAAAAGLDRIVLASSNRVMGGYREASGPIGEELPPRPDGPYGAAKLAGERLGAAVARMYGPSFVALRIGWVQDGPNRIDTLPDDPWSRGLWLSDADLVQLFTRAVEAELEAGEAVVANAMTPHPAGRWPLDVARTRLGHS